jgi:hypothetical protein
MFAMSAELEAVGFDCPKQAGWPSRGDAPRGSQVAHGHCQAVTTGLWASAVLSRLGFKQEIILLDVALLALVTQAWGPSGGDPTFW